MATTRNHLPPPQVTSDHQERTATADLPKRVLPRMDVPSYLLGTPLQEQDRHSDSFHTNQPQVRQQGNRSGFTRPGLADNLALIARNLSRGNGRYFDGSAAVGEHDHLPPATPHARKDDSGEARVPYGDGTPLKGHPKE